MNNDEQKLLDETLDWFNFSKVASVMQHLQWTWHNCDSPGGIPTEPDLRAEVRKQFKYCMERSHGKERFLMGIGGFDYTVWRDKGGHVDVFELKFVIADWSTAG